MGLLDGFFGNADQTQALGLLGAGLAQHNYSGGAQAAMGLLASAPDRELKRKMAQAQYDQAQMGVDEMRRKFADEDATRKVLQGIYAGNGMPQSPVAGGMQGQMPQSPAMSPGAFAPSADGMGPTLPPMPQGQMQQPGMSPGGVTPKADVWQQYKMVGDKLAAQGLVQQAQQYYGMAEKMRPKFGTEPRVMKDPATGQLVNVLVGEDGSTQVVPFGVKPQMKMQDLGGRVVAVDENTLGNGQAFNKSQTPDSAASVAATMRGQNMTDARAKEQIQLGKVPAGYRQTMAGGLEYIPGGPADPSAAKKAAPTEFQGKSATFGARAQVADKILSGLGSDFSPAAINAKTGLDSVPLFGQGLGAVANMALSSNSQKADQAQRDFVNAVLRQESGAAISQGEFDNARKQYFPQPGDSAAVKVQKAQNRQLAINGFRENARPGAVDEVIGGGPGAAPASSNNDPLGLRR